MAQSQIQRVFQTSTPAPTFGQLFGQALVKSIGAPARQAREDRADFLKVAPSLIQQKMIEPTQVDDPNAIKFGKKPVSIGGISFKSTAPKPSIGDQKTALEIEKLRRELNQPLSLSKLQDFYMKGDGILPSAAQTIMAEAEQEIANLKKNEQTPQKIAEIRNRAQQRVVNGLNAFLIQAQGNPQAIGIDPNTGQPTIVIKDGKVTRQAKPSDLTNPNVKFASAADISKPIDVNASTNDGLVNRFAGSVAKDVTSEDSIVPQASLIGLAALGNPAVRSGVSKAAGSLFNVGKAAAGRAAGLAGPIGVGAAAGDLIGTYAPLPSQQFINQNSNLLQAIAGFPFNAVDALTGKYPTLGPAVTGQQPIQADRFSQFGSAL